MKKEIENLIKLLDDESQQCASMAMAGLLRFGSEIGPVLQNLQETDNSRLRKRVHQLQSVLSIRRRREAVAGSLGTRKCDLLGGLIQLHLQWYDDDFEMSIRELWEKLLRNSEKYNPANITKLAYFMEKKGFNVIEAENIDADFFCIGTVLEEFEGADFILCAIAQCLAAQWGFNLKIVQIMGNFSLMDAKCKVLLPANNWQVLPRQKRGRYMEWTPQMLLRLTASMLFLSAVGTDSFRYISTLGECLAGAAGSDDMSFLPYPYSSKRKIN